MFVIEVQVRTTKNATIIMLIMQNNDDSDVKRGIRNFI
jgi:hypothetical protein